MILEKNSPPHRTHSWPIIVHHLSSYHQRANHALPPLVWHPVSNSEAGTMGSRVLESDGECYSTGGKRARRISHPGYTPVAPWPTFPMGLGASDLQLRGQHVTLGSSGGLDPKKEKRRQRMHEAAARQTRRRQLVCKSKYHTRQDKILPQNSLNTNARSYAWIFLKAKMFTTYGVFSAVVTVL